MSSSQSKLEMALDNHLPSKLHYFVCSVGDDYVLLPEEAKYIDHASDHRQQEFAAGRNAAKQALAKLGVNDAPILKAESGEPLWSQGIAGSISHSDDVAIAVVARSDDYQTIGIDLQAFRESHPRLLDRVCTPEEKDLDWHTDKDVALLQLFSIKESVYKAVFPLQREYLGFQDVTVKFEKDNRFTATIKKQQVIEGHSLVLDDQSIFSMTLA